MSFPPFRNLLLGFVLSLSCVTLLSTDAYGRDDKQGEDEVDYLALGARLVADGYHDRALATLKNVDQSAEDVDLAQLHFLFGTIYLHKELFNDARDAFLSSIKAGQANKAIYIYLAQAHFRLGEYRKAVQALDKAPPSAQQSPGSYSMRAEAHWKLKEPKPAIRALDDGIKRFPKFKKLTQMKLGYLIELGLYQEVARVGSEFLGQEDVSPDDFVTVAEGLRRSKQLRDAQLVLEKARLRFPDNLNLTLQLGNVYNDLQRPLSAATLYEAASRIETKYSFEAAELYKQAGRTSRALQLNARTLDAEKKLKQRLSILLEMRRFELIGSMEASLSREGLLKDESIRYALAYGHFKNGDFDAAERHLKRLSDSSLFEKAVALRKAMATCREAGWACY